MLCTFEIFTSDIYEAAMLIDNIFTTNELNEAEKMNVAKKLSNVLGSVGRFAEKSKQVADVFTDGPMSIAKAVKNWLSGGEKLSTKDIEELVEAWESIYTSLSEKMKKTKDKDIQTINRILTKHDSNLKNDVNKYEFLKHTIEEDPED